MIRRGRMALGAIVCSVLCAAPVSAQKVDFLTRAAFHLGAQHLSSEDPRFVWAANFGGDLDLVDYGSGRLNFLADYEPVLGDQFRSFDPNQGNYFLAGSLSQRFRSVEAALVFHHESRHLSDRFKQQPVDWNMLGGRVMKSATFRGARIDARGDLRWVIKKSFVDYRSEFGADVRAAKPIASRVSAIADGGVQFVGTEGSPDRGTQTGYRFEGGVRFEGKAAVELFVSTQRVIDPYPLEFSTAQWLTAGFRLLSR